MFGIDVAINNPGSSFLATEITIPITNIVSRSMMALIAMKLVLAPCCV